MKTPQLLTPDQAAARLQVARTTVLDMLRAKRLVGVKVGPQWRVEPSALDRYIEAQRQCPPADLVARLRDEADNLARYTRRAINAQMRRLAREGEGETR